MRAISSTRSLVLFTLLAGCSQQPEPPSVGAESATPTSQRPDSPAVGPISAEVGVVELTSATAKLDKDQIVRFQVDYRFTSGAPVKTYLCTVNFPNSDQAGVKPLERFELGPEGTFTMGIEVGDNVVDAYELRFSEADSPDRGYTVISNTLTGQVITADVSEDSAPGK